MVNKRKITMTARLGLILIIAATIVTSTGLNMKCISGKRVEAAQIPVLNSIEKPGYTLVANDEFIDPTLNTNLWFPWYLPHWTQRELCAANYEFRNGNLVLKITPEMQPWDPSHDSQTVISSVQTAEKDWLHKWSSSYSGLNHSEQTVTNHLQKYGYFEIRAKMQSGGGIHCAWWMIGFQQDANNWDNSKQTSEVDIFEALGRNGARKLKFNLLPWNDPDTSKTGTLEEIDVGFDMSHDFHVYGFEWDETSMKLYVDGRLVKQRDQSVSYPMLTLLGIYEKRHGGWTGPFEPGVPYPKEFVIDYWRAYQRNDMIHRNNEAEHAVFNGQVIAERVTYGASNGRVARYIGGSPDNWVEFNCLYVNQAGNYNISIDYISGENRNLYLKVNGEQPIQLTSLNSGGWKNISTKNASVYLNKGNNTIRLYNDTAWAPDIDRIRVDLNSNIASSAVVSATSAAADYPITNINDMNRATNYQSKNYPSYPQYITFQWPEGKSFNKVKLSTWYGQGQGITNLDIEVSDDGTTNWTKVISNGVVSWESNSRTVETKEVPFGQVINKKALRLKVNSANSQWNHFAVNEIEIY